MNKITFYSEACNKVDGFRSMGEEFIHKLVINGKSKSTHENYLRQMSKLALVSKHTPLEIEVDKLEEYLYKVYRFFELWFSSTLSTLRLRPNTMLNCWLLNFY